MINSIRNSYQSTLVEKSIPSLDGLRAVSVLLVIIGHFFFKNYNGILDKFVIFQDFGVSLFFVISGYLITNILYNEFEKNRSINFKVFYLKRLFRIFPPYYFLIIVMMALSSIFGYTITTPNLISCFLYLGFYYPSDQILILAHSWSLAIEEQFYMLWPPVIQIFKSKKNIITVILLVILISPFLRILTYYFLPLYKYKYHFLLHTRADSLMFGCILPFAFKDPRFKKLLNFLGSKSSFIFSLLFIFIIHSLLNFYLKGAYRASIGYTLESICLCSIVLHLIQPSKSWYYRLLNSKPFIHIGTISYGIYLWQTPFIELSPRGFTLIPLITIGIYLTALSSYIFLEHPIMRLRSRVIR